MPANFGPGYPAVQAAVQGPSTSAAGGGPVEQSVSDILGAQKVTLYGTSGPVSTDTVTVTIASHGVTYDVKATDTSFADVAVGVAAAINADSTDAAIVMATAKGDEVIITPISAGTYSLSASSSGNTQALVSGASITLLSTLVVPLITQAVVVPAGGSMTLYAGIPQSVDPVTATWLVDNGYANV